jgi:hypothetical protein
MVEDLAFLGSRVRYHLRLPAGRMLTALAPHAGPARVFDHGEHVHVGWRIRDSVLLPG